MNILHKHRKYGALKWVSFLRQEVNFTPSKSNLYVNGLYPNLQQFRSCTTVRAVPFKNGATLGELAKKSSLVRREAQAALSEYFHSTRNIQFMDAENMSKNSPEFFENLLSNVEVVDGNIGKSLTRFLRYSPINEFEPFFESIGLSPSEYSSFLPRNLMFLHHDKVLLDNYYILCSYGIARNKIGKIYKDFKGIFRCDSNVLKSKLKSFENLGLEESFIAMIITSSPYLLEGEELNPEFLQALGKLKKVGIECDWLEKHLSNPDGEFYDWKGFLNLISCFNTIGLGDQQIEKLIKQHPDVLLERSGGISISLLVFFLKFGFTRNEIHTMFLKLPIIPVLKFKNNLFQCYEFLVAVGMDIHEIGSIVRSYPLLLGSCELKKVRSLLDYLNCGKKRLRQLITKDPNVLKTWVLGSWVDPLPNRIEVTRKLQTDFLANLGFADTSKEMEKYFKVFQGRGVELQERFDCLMSNGFTRQETIEMVKKSPQILNQSSDTIKRKIGILTNLGYELSYLATHPKTIAYRIGRVKQRHLFYEWLKDEGLVQPKFALSSLLSCSEKLFVKDFVNCYPGGHKVWKRLKKQE